MKIEYSILNIEQLEGLIMESLILDLEVHSSVYHALGNRRFGYKTDMEIINNCNFVYSFFNLCVLYLKLPLCSEIVNTNSYFIFDSST